MKTEDLASIRLNEAKQIMRFLPDGGDVLEIGAGAGWQARFFAEQGYRVSAVDVASSNQLTNTVFLVTIYDGHHLPFPDHSFDAVFSSNVLEHIPHVAALQKDIKRVCKPGGRIVHVMPTATWRLWTILSHYPWVIKTLIGLGHRRNGSSGTPGEVAGRMTRKTPLEKIRAALIPEAHGPNPNCLTELYRFSRLRWLALFRAAGFSDVVSYPNLIFYTGHRLVGGRLSLTTRQHLSRIFGSACRIYVMKNRLQDEEVALMPVSSCFHS